MSALPVVDIAPLRTMDDVAAVERVAAAIGAASAEYGFFYVEGHGIGDALFDRLEAVSQFFFALPEADKAAIAMANGGLAWRGWFPLGGELTSGRPDRKEGLYLGEELGPDDVRVAAGWPLHGANLWPAALPGLRAAVEDYLAAAVAAAEALMRGMALALGLSAGHFAAGLTRRPTLLFRIFHYPPDGAADELGVGEHSDYGLLTLLGQDAHGGLEVRAANGEWIAVPPRGRALVVNIGDMFERLTRGRFRSAPHRVINASGRERLSWPLFYDPDFAAPVDPLPIPATTRLLPRWDGVDVHDAGGTYGDYLLGKVGKVFPELAGKQLGGFA
ncbi:MAG TPA: 2-oxoglutarate and iron-dependent oxygenase domain-containing protein [Sphingopyxis sp.]|nr:2-oxoglutarate and iron-dependent oxygenase domain-containing protein [Sphingopyxis sp.]HMP43784.1 2-oxoglutarate and iron-dependent oxygenase domain-containing protein [Sphingopyxis sp.]HMQ17515.1 2-oxoglutarate and iron-dependent oxygenase domain-containing protein [Sphingopyxis sp.]